MLFIIRKPVFSDIDEMFDLIEGYASKGIMLPKPHSVLYETLREFVVAEEPDSGKIVGVGALHLTWNELAEIRSVAVHRDFNRLGIGAGIVSRLLNEGRSLGVKKFFTLTYRPEFFESLGFFEVPRESLPHKIWKECIDCPKFANCDETALILEEKDF